MGYRRVPISLLLFTFFSVFVYINLRWYTYSKLTCRTKPMIISETLRDTQSRVIVSSGLLLVSVLTLLSFFPLNLQVIFIALTTLFFACAFIFFVNVVHEVFVALAITCATVVILRTKKSFVSSVIFISLYFLTLLSFVILYFMDIQTCTYNGFIEYVLITQIFVALFANRYNHMKRGYTRIVRTPCTVR
jgi:hypothetical protein